jgi:hypothetical protein
MSVIIHDTDRLNRRADMDERSHHNARNNGIANGPRLLAPQQARFDSLEHQALTLMRQCRLVGGGSRRCVAGAARLLRAFA